MMAKKSRFGGGAGWMGILGGLEMQIYTWNEWAMESYCTAQGNVCGWVTFLYNKTWWNIVNPLSFNNFFLKKKESLTQKQVT